MTEKIQNQKLFIRLAEFGDIAQMVALSKKVYKDDPFTRKMITSHITTFPEGQFVAVYDDKVVGHAATFIIEEKLALKPHTYKNITGNGYITKHNPEGDFLYGMEVCVDPDMRGLRIAQRLYNMRKKLCLDWELKGITFGGRMMHYHKHARKGVTPEEYLEGVRTKKYRDPALGLQIRNGFEPIRVLKKYLIDDKESLDFAAHMVWYNAMAKDSVRNSNAARRGSVRLASVQFQVRKVESFADFIKQVEYFVDIASDYNSDFVVFPELYTLALLSAEKKRLTPEESVRAITQYTDQYIEAMTEMAISHNINIIGGTHPTMVDDELKNIAYVFLRGGEVHTQEKIQPTPNERYWWNMVGGDHLSVIQTDCGPIGVLICYDSEFPELARHLADQGALMLFVPFCTDERQGYLRVKYCAQARAIENQFYVITSGVVGNLPDVENMDIHYAASDIITPCDFPFARDGIAATAPVNTETIIFADLNIDDLLMARNSGTVQNFRDRRFDLYEIKWHK